MLPSSSRARPPGGVPPEDEEVAGKHLSAALVNGHNRGSL